MENRSLKIMVCVFAAQACIIKKNTVEKSLARAVATTSQQSTCERLLPAAEYKALTAALTPADPLVVASTNDIHGHTDERLLKLKISENESVEVGAGGFARLAAYLSAMCREAKGRLIYLDSGDSYQGTALSNASSGLAVVESFSSLGLMAATFGNHEFDFGQNQIKNWLAHPKRNFWYVTSSVGAQSDGKSIPWAELGAPSFARSVVFDVAGVRVGIAGYTTDSTPVKSIPDNVRDLSFRGLADVYRNESEPLRRQGAQVNILLSHAGGSCDMKLPPEQGDLACKNSPADELGTFLRESGSDRGRWNLVVAGHTHSPQSHLIGGVPVVQTSGLGLSLTYTKIRVLPQGVTVELGKPVYLCREHFESWKGCHPEEWEWRDSKISTTGKAVPPTFAGRVVNINDGARVNGVLEPWRAELGKYMSRPVTTFKQELVHDRTGLSPAAACLADAWLEGLKAADEKWNEHRAADLDAVFLNSGALRSGVSSGQLLWGKLFEIIPYDNTAHVAALSAEELTAFARAHESSPHDYLLASNGWSVIRTANDRPSPRTVEVRRNSPAGDSGKKWLVAVTTYSKSFMRSAGIKTEPIDTGLSVRDLIGKTLASGISAIASCSTPDLQRMKIQGNK
jgi:5'-nucleotidase